MKLGLNSEITMINKDVGIKHNLVIDFVNVQNDQKIVPHVVPNFVNKDKDSNKLPSIKHEINTTDLAIAFAGLGWFWFR